MYELTTQYDEGLGTYNSLSSTIFTIRASKNITLNSFDLNLNDTQDPTNCLVYTKPGIFSDIFDIKEWDLVSNTTLTSAGLGLPTPILEFAPTNLVELTEQTFFINTNQSNLILINADSQNIITDDIYSHNSDLEIYAGIGSNDFWGDLVYNQIWSGSVWYGVGESESIPENEEEDDSELETYLVTTFGGKMLSYGSLFYIYALKDIILKTIDMHTSTLDDPIHIQIYTMKENEEWIKICDTTRIGMGYYVATIVPTDDFESVKINANTKQSFYITSDNKDIVTSFREKSVVGDVDIRNDDLWLYLGQGVTTYSYDLQSNDEKKLLEKMAFNGILRYELLRKNSTKKKVDCPDSIDGYVSNLIRTPNNGHIKSYVTKFYINAKQTFILRTISLHINSFSDINYSIWMINVEDDILNEDEKKWAHLGCGTVDARGKGISTVIPIEDFQYALINEDTTKLIHIKIDAPDLLSSTIRKKIWVSNDVLDILGEETQSNVGIYYSLIDSTCYENIRPIQNDNDGSMESYCDDSPPILHGTEAPTVLTEPPTISPTVLTVPSSLHTVKPSARENPPTSFIRQRTTSPTATESLLPTTKPTTIDYTNSSLNERKKTTNTTKNYMKVEYFYSYLIRFPKLAVVSEPDTELILEIEQLWKMYLSKHQLYPDRNGIVTNTYTTNDSAINYWCSDNHEYLKPELWCTVVNSSVAIDYDPTTTSATTIEYFFLTSLESIIKTVSSNFDNNVLLLGPSFFTKQFKLHLLGNEQSLNFVWNKGDEKYVKNVVQDHLVKNMDEKYISIYNVTLLSHQVETIHLVDDQKDNNTKPYLRKLESGQYLALYVDIKGKVSNIDVNHTSIILNSFVLPPSSFSFLARITSYVKFEGVDSISGEYLDGSIISSSADEVNDTDSIRNLTNIIIYATIGALIILVVLCILFCFISRSDESSDDRQRKSSDHSKKKSKKRNVDDDETVFERHLRKSKKKISKHYKKVKTKTSDLSRSVKERRKSYNESYDKERIEREERDHHNNRHEKKHYGHEDDERKHHDNDYQERERHHRSTRNLSMDHGSNNHYHHERGHHDRGRERTKSEKDSLDDSHRKRSNKSNTNQQDHYDTKKATSHGQDRKHHEREGGHEDDERKHHDNDYQERERHHRSTRNLSMDHGRNNRQHQERGHHNREWA